MRHLTRDKARAERLLERARTSRSSVPRARRGVGRSSTYLRGAGYDVVPVGSDGVAAVPGALDLVLVFGTPRDVPRLLRDAAAKRADGVWFTDEIPGREARPLAPELGLAVVVDGDVIGRHRERLREAGQPPKLGVRPRRRRREAPDPGLASPTGWKEGGGGGSQGGGGGRAELDEKKIVRGRSGRRGRRRAFRGRSASAA